MRPTLSSCRTLPPEELAKLARLRYVTDQAAGILRRRNGKGFIYTSSRGQSVADRRALERITRLAIPPAWKDVWICRLSNGHLQATGRDVRQRKQYLYHERWREIANLSKFCYLEQFGRLLPKLRQTVARHLKQEGLTRRRILAGLVALLDVTSIRVGNEEYVKENGSFGLTTLRDRHVFPSGDQVELRFRGKGGLRRQVVLEHPELAELVLECRAVAGPRLFQYPHEEGKICAVDSFEVNEYLRELTGQPFTAKDFRTWKASALVAGLLFERRDEEQPRRRKAALKEAVQLAAETLANTPAICRNYYIHPGLLQEYESGAYGRFFDRFVPRRQKRFAKDEQVLMHFLHRWEAPLAGAAGA